MDYRGSEVLGCYLQSGGNRDPIVDSKVEEFEKHLDFEKIKKINEGEPVFCNSEYFNYQDQHPEFRESFKSAEILQNYISTLNNVSLNGRPTILARCAVVAQMIFPLFNIYSDDSKNLRFRKSGGNLIIESVLRPESPPDWIQHDVGTVSENMIIVGNVFEKEERPTLGETCLYRSIKHNFDQFDLIVSKELDAGIEDPVEIRSLHQGLKLNIKKLLFKALVIGCVRKAVINYIEENNLTKVVFIDDIQKLDKDNHVPRFQQAIAYVFNWLLDFITESEANEGELHVSPYGIVARCSWCFAIFNKRHPENLKLLENDIKPRIYLSQSVFKKASFLNQDLCHLFYDIKKYKPAETLSDLTIIFAMNVEEMNKYRNIVNREYKQDMNDSNCILLVNYRSHCDTEYSKVHFQEFILSICPGIIKLQKPKDKVLVVIPEFLKLPTVEKCKIYKEELWTCNLEKENFIVSHSRIHSLQKILSLHVWLEERRPVTDLTVVMITVIGISEEVIRGLLEKTFCETTANTAKIVILDYEKQSYGPWMEELATILGGIIPPFTNGTLPIEEKSQETILHLVGSDVSLNLDFTNPFDLQLVSNFVENGLLSHRLFPDKIVFSGSDEEFELVKERLRKDYIRIPLERRE